MAACMQGAGCVLTICTVLMVSRTNTLGGVLFTYYVLPCVLLLWGLLLLLYWSAGGEWMVVVVAGREMYVTDIDYYIWSTSSAMLPSFTVCDHVLLLCMYVSFALTSQPLYKGNVMSGGKCRVQQMLKMYLVSAVFWRHFAPFHSFIEFKICIIYCIISSYSLIVLFY